MKLLDIVCPKTGRCVERLKRYRGIHRNSPIQTRWVYVGIFNSRSDQDALMMASRAIGEPISSLRIVKQA